MLTYSIGKHQLNETLDLLCIGILLKDSKLDSANKVALKCIDKAAEDTIKLYCNAHQLDIQNDSDVFSSVLPLLKEKKLIIPSDENSILNLHKLSKSVFETKTHITNTDVEEYITLVKILLAYLHHYRASKNDWRVYVSNIKKTICGVDQYNN